MRGSMVSQMQRGLSTIRTVPGFAACRPYTSLCRE
jgi:hypothetical protein